MFNEFLTFCIGYPLQHVQKCNEIIRHVMNSSDIWMGDHRTAFMFDGIHDMLQGIPLAKCHEHRENSMTFNDVLLESPWVSLDLFDFIEILRNLMIVHWCFDGDHRSACMFYEFQHILQGLPLAKCYEHRGNLCCIMSLVWAPKWIPRAPKLSTWAPSWS